jgi:hypothetical protein
MELKAIQDSDLELLFDPHSDQLYPGENIQVVDSSGTGIIAQVILLRSVEYPTLLQEQLRDGLSKGFIDTHRISIQESSGTAYNLKDLQVARCKVRACLKGNAWNPWNGRVPMRSAKMTFVDPKALIEHTVGESHAYAIWLGYADCDEKRPLYIDASTLEKIGLIAGDKDMGKSHLAKVLILGLTEMQARCVVIEMNEGDYSNLRGALVLVPGSNFKLSLTTLPVSQFLKLVGETLPPASMIMLENMCEALWRDAWLEVGSYERLQRDARRVHRSRAGFLPFAHLMERVRQGYYLDRADKVTINSWIQGAL